MDPGGSAGDREDAGRSGPAEAARFQDLMPGVSKEDRGAPIAAAGLEDPKAAPELVPRRIILLNILLPSKLRVRRRLQPLRLRIRLFDWIEEETTDARGVNFKHAKAMAPNRMGVFDLTEEDTAAAMRADFKRRKPNTSIISTVPRASAFSTFVRSFAKDMFVTDVTYCPQQSISRTLSAAESAGGPPPHRPMLIRILQITPNGKTLLPSGRSEVPVNQGARFKILGKRPAISHTSMATHRETNLRAWWRTLRQEDQHHDDMSSWVSSKRSKRIGDRRTAGNFFSCMLKATDILLDVISSPPLSSSDVGNHLKRIKALLYDVKIEMMRDDSIHLLLKELKDLTAEVENLVDQYLYRLLQIQEENRNSATEAFPVGMQMHKNKEEKLDIQTLIHHYDISERIKMIRKNLFEASVVWKSRAKPSNYVTSATLKKSKEYELLRAQVLEQATTRKASLELKGTDKDEAGAAPAVTSAQRGSFDKFVEISSSNSSGIILNRDEEIKDKTSKDWEAACHSKEDRKRVLGGCVSDLPPNIQICGRDIDKDKIIKLLLPGIRSNFSPFKNRQGTNKFKVIPILGMAGVGKSTLAKLVYNDPTVCEHFDARGWVHVSSDTTDVSLLKSITSSITGKSCYGNELNHLQTILHEELIGKRLLLVLDDIFNHTSFPWKSMLALLSGAMFGKIIVTSRDELLPMTVYGSIPYYLGCLPLDKSWDLFRMFAFHGLNLDSQDELAEIGMMILSKCDYFPLDVKILGSLLNFRFDKNIWTDVLESEIWKTETLPALVLSYNLLPSYLKPCFLYCSMFPKGYKFDKYELVRLWMAQDYIEPKCNKSLEDTGCEYFCELQRMSFFDKSWDGTFIMHDLLYELSKSISGHEFCTIDDSDTHDIDDGVCHLYAAGGYQRKNSLSFVKPETLKSLLYQTSDGRIPKSLLTSSSMKHLRVLELKCHEDFMVQETTHQIDLNEATISSLSYGELIHLRYLQICDKNIESLSTSVCNLYHLQTLTLDNCSNLRELPSEIGHLLNLRYLGLSKVNIKMLPDSVCRLLNLQSLIVNYCRNLYELPMLIGKLVLLQHLGLSGTNITRLPESICYLLKVRILKLDDCTNFVEFPSNIGDLANLQEMEVTSTRIARLPDSVCSLFNLLKLDMAESDLLVLPSAIGNLSKLNYLGLSHTKIEMLPESLSQLSNLHILKLNGCTNLSHLPSGIGALTSLHHLILSDTNIAELPESLCQLSNLQTLELDSCIRCHSLPSDIGDLISLVHLKLSDTDISELPTSFCRLSYLETLELNYCYRFSQLPDNIGDLSNLSELEITETEIKELPKSLCQLGKLKKLKLNGNKNLEEFPQGIENLSNLSSLELREVGIKELPEHIGKLKKLVKLSFESKYKPTVGFQ